MASLLNQHKHFINNVDETDRVLFEDIASMAIERDLPTAELPGIEPAEPRKKTYFDPSKTRAGVVMCGGLCPGFNDIIRGLVMELTSAPVVRLAAKVQPGRRDVRNSATVLWPKRQGVVAMEARSATCYQLASHFRRLKAFYPHVIGFHSLEAQYATAQ